MKPIVIFLWIVKLVAVFLMVQSLFFKFSGSSESIYIFTKVGMEPWGRYGTGIAELIASILLLIPRTSWMGALLGLGVISGAILSHLTVLGIEVKNADGTFDGGQLFMYALLTFACCLTVLIFQRHEALAFVTKLFLPKSQKS